MKTLINKEKALGNKNRKKRKKKNPKWQEKQRIKVGHQ